MVQVSKSTGRNRPNPSPATGRDRDNLHARIAEARREGWLGEVDGLQISLIGAREKLAPARPCPSADTFARETAALPFTCEVPFRQQDRHFRLSTHPNL